MRLSTIKVNALERNGAEMASSQENRPVWFNPILT